MKNFICCLLAVIGYHFAYAQDIQTHKKINFYGQVIDSITGRPVAHACSEAGFTLSRTRPRFMLDQHSSAKRDEYSRSRSPSDRQTLREIEVVGRAQTGLRAIPGLVVPDVAGARGTGNVDRSRRGGTRSTDRTAHPQPPRPADRAGGRGGRGA